MCGLLWADSKSGKVGKSIIKRYKHQNHRGTQGVAFLGLKDGVVDVLERSSEDTEILKKLRDDLSNRVLFHHRFPTSTVNIPEATHPIVVEKDDFKYNYYVIHNGVLQNEKDLKKEHELLGFKYTTVIKNVMTYEINEEVYYGEEHETFNDSESLAIDLALLLEGKSDKLKSRGSIAFICLQTDKNDVAQTLYFGRNDGNPLVVEDNGDLLCIKSEGSGMSIHPDTLYQYSLLDDKKKITMSPLEVGEYYGRKVSTPARKYSWEKESNEYQDEIDRYGHMGSLLSPLSEELRAKNFQRDKDGVWRYHEPRKLDDDFDDVPRGYEDIQWKDYNITDLYEELYFIQDNISDARASMEDAVSKDEDTTVYQYDLEYFVLEEKEVSDEILFRETYL